MNKKLVAQFMASVDVMALPTFTLDLDEMEEWEVQEVTDRAVEFEYEGVTRYIIPSSRYHKGIQQVDCYVVNDDGKLSISDYQPSLEEVSEILEQQGWRGDWVPQSRVEESLADLLID